MNAFIRSHRITHFLRLYGEELLFLCIVLVGAYIRFYQVFNGLPWADDAGRDLLVAKHITESSAPLWSAPPASGTSFVNNTPLYYWFISVIYFFGRSVSFVMIAFTFIGMATIFLAYLLGKVLRSSFMGLTLASLVAFSYITIVPSRSILQPNVTGALVMLTLLFYVRFHRSESFRDGIFLVVTMFCGIAFHLGYLPVFVFFSITLIWDLVRARKLHKNLIIFLIYYAALFFWILMYTKIPALRLYFHVADPINHREMLQGVGLGMLNFSKYLFFGTPLLLKIILADIVFLLLCVQLSPKFLKKIPVLAIYGALFWACALFAVCLVYGKDAPYYYYDSFYIMALVGFSFLIERIVSHKLKVLLAILFIVGTAYSTKSIIYSEPSREFFSAREASVKVLEDYNKYDDHAGPAYNFWVVAAQGDYPGIFGMFSEQYWYILETLTEKELTEIVSGPQNSRPIVNSPRFIYLICKVGEFNFASVDECVDQMSLHYSYDFARIINPTLVDKIVTRYFTLHIIRYERIEKDASVF